jgi:hypothetical protein
MLATAPQSLALGQLGSLFINDTSAQTGRWGRIYCISACGFTLLTSSTMSGTLNALTLAAGMEIQGIFTAITLNGGSVIAYNA